MNIVNEKGDDLSPDMLLNIGVMLAFIQGTERICNVLNRKVEAQRYTVKMLREKKQAFNEASRVAKRLQYILDNYFTEPFDIIESTKDKCNAMTDLSLIMVRMGIAYLSRIDKDNKNIERCLKKVMEYKGVPELHVEEILEMYVRKGD